MKKMQSEAIVKASTACLLKPRREEIVYVLETMAGARFVKRDKEDITVAQLFETHFATRAPVCELCG